MWCEPQGLIGYLLIIISLLNKCNDARKNDGLVYKNGGQPMTKKELSRLYWLNREIEEQQRRLSELETIGTSCTATITGMPKVYNISDKLAKYTVEIANLRTLLDLNLKKCLYELDRLNQYMNSIEDGEMRLILSLRYINGLTWLQIAFSIGAHDEQYPRRKHNRFIESFQNDGSNLLL